jgi:L-alanine-DL-glutamate epimerase-like enolase superfamily enzyme
MTGRQLAVTVERWPIAGSFAISRGAKSEAVVVVATISQGNDRGRGECVPYGRYGESVDGVVAAIEQAAPLVADGLGRRELLTVMPAGAARNAIDCALWDLEAKTAGTSAAALSGRPPLHAVVTAYTISLAEPDAMARQARAEAGRPLLKLKLGGQGDRERMAAVRAAVPAATLIVDANEAWAEADFAEHMAAAVAAGIALIEQPLPAGADAVLTRLPRRVPVCADESFHGVDDLPRLADRYDAVNIKLDKCGGLTAALAVLDEVERRGLTVMIGCMVGTSLAMAPAMLLAQRADFVDLDGSLLLARDREAGLIERAGRLQPPTAALWG